MDKLFIVTRTIIVFLHLYGGFTCLFVCLFVYTAHHLSFVSSESSDAALIFCFDRLIITEFISKESNLYKNALFPTVNLTMDAWNS